MLRAINTLKKLVKIQGGKEGKPQSQTGTQQQCGFLAWDTELRYTNSVSKLCLRILHSFPWFCVNILYCLVPVVKWKTAFLY